MSRSLLLVCLAFCMSLALVAATTSSSPSSSSSLSASELQAFNGVEERADEHQHPLSMIRVDRIKHHKASTATIQIDAPNKLKSIGQNVVVKFSGVSPSAKGLFVALYSPKPKDYTKKVPVKYKFVTVNSSGAGQTTLWFLNMRAGYTAALFSGGILTPTLLAESNQVDFENYDIPLQLHISYTANISEMRINWNTRASTAPVLAYGTTKSLGSFSTNITTVTYDKTDLCGAPGSTKGWRKPGLLHSALVTGLEPNTQYYYQVSDSKMPQASSSIYSFFAPPVPSPNTEVDFVLFGDLGQIETDGSNEHSQMHGSILTTTALLADLDAGVIAKNKSAAIFHIGDISYARGYASLWEQYFYQIRAVARQLPWMTSIGNHERDFPDSGSFYTGHDSGGECGVAFESRFSYPSPVPPRSVSGATQHGSKGDTPYWSLNYGPIHFTHLSTEHAFNSSSEQYKWVEQDWQKVDRLKTPFLILTGHRPAYLDSPGEKPFKNPLQHAFEPLMRKYRVDLAMWGHHHSYQRTCPVFNFTCMDEKKPHAEAAQASEPSLFESTDDEMTVSATNDEGIIHIVIGNSGAGLSSIKTVAPSWIRFAEDTYWGYVRGNVRDNVLKLDFVRSKDRTVQDSVSIPSKFPTKKLAAADSETEFQL